MGVAIAMGAMAAGSALFGSMQQGQQQVANNAIQRLQHEEQEFERKMQNQIKNRQIAQANAAKWMANRNIAASANQARAEKEFWLGYNFDNATGQFSRQYNQVNTKLQSVMQTKNINPNSGTARSLMNGALEQAKKGLISQRTQHGNALLSARREQEGTLAKRDFGYASQVKFMPSTLHQISDSSIMSQALTTGLVSGAVAGVGAGLSTQVALAGAGYDSMGGTWTGEGPPPPGGVPQSQFGFLFG